MATFGRPGPRDLAEDRVLVLSTIVLLTANLALALLHGGYFVCLRYGLDAWPRNPIFSLDCNTGLAQAFSSAQTLVLIVLLLNLAHRSRELLYRALGAVFVVVLLDDAFALDQLLGRPLVGMLGLVDQPRLLAQSIAEMLVYGALGVPVLALLGLGWRQASPAHRWAGAAFVLLLGLLTFFATVMDLVHLAFIRSFRGSRLVLELLEEGGEMATLSTALLLALALTRQASPATVIPGYRLGTIGRLRPADARGSPTVKVYKKLTRPRQGLAQLRSGAPNP